MMNFVNCVFFTQKKRILFRPQSLFNNPPEGMVGSIWYVCSCAMNNDLSKFIIFFFPRYIFDVSPFDLPSTLPEMEGNLGTACANYA